MELIKDRFSYFCSDGAKLMFLINLQHFVSLFAILVTLAFHEKDDSQVVVF